MTQRFLRKTIPGQGKWEQKLSEQPSFTISSSLKKERKKIVLLVHLLGTAVQYHGRGILYAEIVPTLCFSNRLWDMEMRNDVGGYSTVLLEC